MALEKYTTTVVGAYSLPRWYEVLQKQVEARALSMEDMRDAQWRCTQAALVDQETAGIDVVNGGEMHRRQNNRHAPRTQCSTSSGKRYPGSKKIRPRSTGS
jgi:5-methyltetrahydropteroyltriglutamate--homocysteine methyltransferase